MRGRGTHFSWKIWTTEQAHMSPVVHHKLSFTEMGCDADKTMEKRKQTSYSNLLDYQTVF